MFQAAYLNVNTQSTPETAARGLKLNHGFASHGLRLADFDNRGADGTVIGQCQQRHTHAEWLSSCARSTARRPRARRCICWLTTTPTSASWLNRERRFFRDIPQKVVRVNARI